MCPSVADGRVELQGVVSGSRRSSRGPFARTWWDAVKLAPYLEDRHAPDTPVVDLYCPAFVHELSTGGKPEMDRLEVWARHAGVWPVAPVAPVIGELARARARARWADLGLDPLRTVAMSPSASIAVRSYRPGRAGLLVEELRRQGLQVLVLDTADGDTPGLRSVDRDIETQIALLAMSRCFVGPDSGMLHVAMCLGVPSVGIFGPTSPSHILGCYRTAHRAVVGRWSEGTYMNHGCRGACMNFASLGYSARRCPGRCAAMEEIPETEIAAAVVSLLNSPARSLAVR